VALLAASSPGCGGPAVLGVGVELLGTAHTGLAHATGDHGGMGGLATSAGEDAFGGDHALEVVGGGLPATQDDLHAVAGPFDRGVGVEDGFADGGSGCCVHGPSPAVPAGAGRPPLGE